MAKLIFHDCACLTCRHEWSQGVPPRACPRCHSASVALLQMQEDNLPPRV